MTISTNTPEIECQSLHTVIKETFILFENCSKSVLVYNSHISIISYGRGPCWYPSPKYVYICINQLMAFLSKKNMPLFLFYFNFNFNFTSQVYGYNDLNLLFHVLLCLILVCFSCFLFQTWIIWPHNFLLYQFQWGGVLPAWVDKKNRNCKKW